MNTEKEFIKAFNNGYILAWHKPVLLNTIFQNLPSTNTYLQGLVAGKNQFDLEKSKEQILELKKIRNKLHGRENDFEKQV